MAGLLVVLALASGCADDGRELAEARPWQTTTTRPLPPTSAPPSLASESGAVLESPDFAPGSPAPIDATCGGANQPPTLQWSGLPEYVNEVVIVLADQTDPAKPLLLWLAAGIDPARGELRADTLEQAAVISLNDYGRADYGDPCLETLSEGRRDLQFRLYLLDRPSEIAPLTPGNEAWERVKAMASESAGLLMTLESSEA